MNKLIASTTLILLFNFVEYGSSDLICKVFEPDAERLPMFAECVTTNFPESFLNIIENCYETAFGSPGTVRDFLDQSCAWERNFAGMTAMNQCMSIKQREEFERIGMQLLNNAYEATEACFLQKAGLTRSEYIELQTAHSSEAEEDED